MPQSFAGWPYAREGGLVKTEEDPLDPSPPALRTTLAAICHLEAAVTGADGLDGLAALRRPVRTRYLRGAPGLYNIVDDDPAPVAEWLPVLAAAVGAKLARRVPAWVGRLAVGEHGVAMMNEIRGASNAKAKRELGWEPGHPTWRQGFRELGGGRQAPARAAVGG